MQKLCSVILIVLTGCINEDDMSFFQALIGAGSADNNIYVIFDAGQSNSVGRATPNRIINLTSYPFAPNNVYFYNKPNYTVTDNGNFALAQEGGFVVEPGETAYSGCYYILASNLKRITSNPIYVIPAGDGGTSLKENLTTPDWYEGSTGECFEIFTERYYQVAIAKVETLHPTKTIVPIWLWHQGEADAGDADGTSGYAARFATFVPAVRAQHSTLSNCLLIITKLYYLLSANETTINNAFQAYADANPSLVKIIDISGINRKMDLTVAEKGGVPTLGADDEHTSYLGQISKGEQAYAFVKARYAPSINDAEITTNTGFDPATLSSAGIRLQFCRDKMTIGQYSSVSAVVNDLSTGTFSTIVATIPHKFKLEGRRGNIETLVASSARIQSSAAIGSTLIDGSFSVSFWLDPRDGNPSAAMTICHDIQNTSAPNNSRFEIFIDTAGKIGTYISISGTTVSATTNVAQFSNGVNASEKHIAVVYQQGGTVKIYVNGVSQALGAGTPGDLSALTLSNYVNTTNVFTIGATRTGGSSYGSYYVGGLREFTFQPVVYSQADVNNLMLN